ncbi:MAG: MoaD/ThiS family protein [Proteobacteria bacterium]|nr:MoaD/ThiS family protein [Pseudomonadota bacterium]MBS0463759.1 MoaD/ThiS family protein [Pseudomonadota bacterium]
MRVRLLYFASLRDQAQRESECVEVQAGSLQQLYEAAQERHGFALPRARLRVARNGAFAHWQEMAAEGDEVAFIPPVSGG